MKIGRVESLWRYPVKSMRGEELDTLFAGYAGVHGDRLFAFHSTGSRKGLPYLTAREKTEMLRYRPRFRYPEKAIAPGNLAEAERLAPGATPAPDPPEDLMLEVETPAGETLAIDSPRLIEVLSAGLDGKRTLSLRRSERAMTDCRPVSLFSLQTARQLAKETGISIDKRRFRANIYLDLTNSDGFAENDFVGRALRIGAKVTLAIVELDSRCMIITLDPETAEKSPAVLKAVAQAHGGTAGLYAAVLVQGMIRQGDTVELLP